jgi:hypothetical protein
MKENKETGAERYKSPAIARGIVRDNPRVTARGEVSNIERRYRASDT